MLWLGIGCWVAGEIADDEALGTLSNRVVEAARDQGALIHLANGLLYLSMYNLLNGSVERARSTFAERNALMAAVGIAVDVGPMVIAAWAGNEAEARVEIEAVSRYAVEHQQGWMFGFVDYARQTLELGCGNYEAALADGVSDYQDDSFLGCQLPEHDRSARAIRSSGRGHCGAVGVLRTRHRASPRRCRWVCSLARARCWR